MVFGIALVVLLGLLAVAVLVAVIGYIVLILNRPRRAGQSAQDDASKPASDPQLAQADAADPPPTQPKADR